MTRAVIILAAIAILALWLTLRGRTVELQAKWGSLYERNPETGCYDPWLEHECDRECEA